MADASRTDGDSCTYFVPVEFFALLGPSIVKGSIIFKCKKCVNKTISASTKSRYNLNEHVKKKHPSSLDTFKELCAKNDKRKPKLPDTTTTTPIVIDDNGEGASSSVSLIFKQ